MQKVSPPSEPHRIGYARVSTADQELRLQIDALLKDGVREDAIYRETASGASRRRPQFQAMMRDLRPGDVVTVWKLDRLGRSLRDMLDTVERIHEIGARLRIITQQIDTSCASGRMFLQMLAVISEFEREIGRERTRAGLAAAREQGRRGGRKLLYTEEQIRAAMALHDQGQSWMQVAAAINISPTRLQARARALREKDAQARARKDEE